MRIRSNIGVLFGIPISIIADTEIAEDCEEIEIAKARDVSANIDSAVEALTVCRKQLLSIDTLMVKNGP